MQDSLIGYLLGALDDAEAERLEAQLERDPKLKAQLRDAAASLQVLRSDPDDIEPPSGLAAMTCDFVEDQAITTAARRRESYHSHSNESWTMIDFVIAASVLLAACMLALPAINNSRYHAGIAGCQNNLRSIGRALIEYSNTNASGMFPQVPETGNFAVAGMYASALLRDGFIQAYHHFYCPSQTKFAAIVPLPRTDEIMNASGETLTAMQELMGGDFGFPLGMWKNNKLCGIRNQGRSHFALMSESPDRFQCGEVPNKNQHRNLLFECGRVQTMQTSTVCWRGDQLYVNDHGEVSPGIHDGDTVIAPSATPAVPVHFVSGSSSVR